MMRGSGSNGADLDTDVEGLVSAAPSASALRWRLLGRFISSSKPGAYHRSPFPLDMDICRMRTQEQREPLCFEPASVPDPLSHPSAIPLGSLRLGCISCACLTWIATIQG